MLLWRPCREPLALLIHVANFSDCAPSLPQPQRTAPSVSIFQKLGWISEKKLTTRLTSLLTL